MNKYMIRIEDEIIQRLMILDDVPSRNRETILRGRNTFLDKAIHMRLSVSENEKLRHKLMKKRNSGFLFRKEHFTMPAIISALLIVAILLGGTGGTVYAAQSSLPDEILYPVKTLSEDIRLNMTTDITNRVDLLEDYIGRRFGEITEMIQNEDDLPQDVVNRLQMQLDQTLRLTSQLQDQEMVTQLLQLHEKLQTHERLMQQVQLNFPQADGQMERIREMVQSRIRVIEDGLSSPQTIRQRLNNPNENVPERIPGVVEQDQNPQQGNSQINGMGTTEPQSVSGEKETTNEIAGTEDSSVTNDNRQQLNAPTEESGNQGLQKNPEHTPILDGQGPEGGNNQFGQGGQSTSDAFSHSGNNDVDDKRNDERKGVTDNGN